MSPGASPRTLESRRSALPAPRPPLLAGPSPLAPSRSPEGMRQRRDARLPGSAARTSDSGECGARRGMGVPGASAGRGFWRVLWFPIHFSKLPERNFLRGVWRTLPFPTSCFPRAQSNADAKALWHRPWLRTDGPGSTEAQLHRARLCRGASFQTLGSCLVMGNGFSPRTLGGDIFHRAVSPVWRSVCW